MLDARNLFPRPSGTWCTNPFVMKPKKMKRRDRVKKLHHADGAREGASPLPSHESSPVATDRTAAAAAAATAVGGSAAAGRGAGAPAGGAAPAGGRAAGAAPYRGARAPAAACGIILSGHNQVKRPRDREARKKNGARAGEQAGAVILLLWVGRGTRATSRLVCITSHKHDRAYRVSR